MNSQEVKDMAARAEHRMREGLADAEDKALATAEDYRSKTADALHRGADKAREFSSRTSSDDAARLSRRTGEGLDDAADYMERHNLRQIAADCTSWMRQNPGASLAVAMVAGVIVGRALRR